MKNNELIIEGRSAWDFCCAWYSTNEIADAAKRGLIPTDVTSTEFAEWMAHQYRLAMHKGMRIVAAISKEDDFRDAMSSLSSWLGHGLGGEKTSAREFEERIRAGVNTIIEVETKRRQEAERKLKEAESHAAWTEARSM